MHTVLFYLYIYINAHNCSLQESSIILLASKINTNFKNVSCDMH